jgi:hypothetical protein
MTTRGDRAQNVQQDDLKGMLLQVAVKEVMLVSVQNGSSALKCNAIRIVKSPQSSLKR